MDPTQSSYACPRCLEPLVTAAATDVTLHGCASCGGIWLSEADSHKAIAGLASPTVGMVKAADANARQAPDRTGWAACPQCGARMERNEYGPARADIDFCAGHGTWFDKGELLAVHNAAMGVPAAPPAPAIPSTFDTALDTVVPQMSSLAIVGFVLSFFCGIIGLVVSAIAHNEIKNSQGRLTGEGLAVAGMVIGALSMLVGCLISLGNQ